MPYVWCCTCRCCGKIFESARETALLCGATCRQRAARQRKGRLFFVRKTWFRPEYSIRPMLLHKPAGDGK